MNAVTVRSMDYSDAAKAEIIEHIVDELSLGKRSLARIIAEDEGMCSSRSFYAWLAADPVASARVERAREDAAMKLMEEIPEIAENVKADKDEIAKAKLRIYARDLFASKIAPKRFGNKLDLTSGGDKLPAAATDNRLQAIVGVVQQRKAKEIDDGTN